MKADLKRLFVATTISIIFIPISKYCNCMTACVLMADTLLCIIIMPQGHIHLRLKVINIMILQNNHVHIVKCAQSLFGEKQA